MQLLATRCGLVEMGTKLEIAIDSESITDANTTKPVHSSEGQHEHNWNQSNKLSLPQQNDCKSNKRTLSTAL